MKQIFCLLLSGWLLTGAAAASAPNTDAAAVVLMDADSGRVLYERNSREPRLIASITKLMTALVALESGHDTGEVVTIHPEWTGIEGSSLYLRPGEELKLETLLYGLLLRSGNDAAHAIAGHCGGMEDFVARMNAKAEVLGMKNSSFANPSGLNAEGHYSSAYDMALLARACLENKTLAQIASTRSITLEGRYMTNHNKLLWQVEGCIGFKTGYTEKAGRTLVSAVQRDGMTLICVTLGDPNDWKDHTALYDYGFGRFRRQNLCKTGELLCSLPLKNSLLPQYRVYVQEELWCALGSGERAELSYELSTKELTAPVPVGTQIGEAVFSVNGVEIGRHPLVISREIPLDTVQKEQKFPIRIFGR